MTLNSYLMGLKDCAIIRDNEKTSIDRSIVSIKKNLDNHFGAKLDDTKVFGSYTRNTILPRNMDKESDIDLMVIFHWNKIPQTYLDKLRTFTEKYYRASVKKQSYPVIKLDLNHITFDLVPTIYDTNIYNKISELYIPNKDIIWQRTDPNDFNDSLTEHNKNHSLLTKPLIRIMKYWNANNGYICESFELEKWIISNKFYPSIHTGRVSYNLLGLLEQCVKNLGYRSLYPDYNKVQKLKRVVNNAINHERNGRISLAMQEIKKVLPPPNGLKV